MMKAKVIKEWTTKAGLIAYMVINSRGNINGYVAVPRGHKGFEMEYYVYSVDFEDLSEWTDPGKKAIQRKINDIEVHGGLTYSKLGLSKLIETDDWIFGFDTAHAGDGYNSTFTFKHLSESEDTIEEFMKTQYGNNFADDVWRNETYVENECEELAKQLALL